MIKEEVAVFWFRRDLRLTDNTGLHHALKGGVPVLPIFIFDTDILDKLEDRNDRRVDYIHQAICAINEELKGYGTTLSVYQGKVMDIFEELHASYRIQGVYCNRDYEPQAIQRDTAVFRYFQEKGISFKAYKDQVIFDKGNIVKSNGEPYTVYTPYATKWKQTLQESHYAEVNLELDNFFRQPFMPVLALADLSCCKTDITYVEPTLDRSIIETYDATRDFPAIKGTTNLSIALRFGTISIRKCVSFALQYNQTWLSELIWREFFMQILYHFPQVVDHAFKEKYDRIAWRNEENLFKLWCEGKTGYPMVDAGMRELNATGFMHNRVRMVVASFLCKHLLIDWRWGEAYFAAKLNDYELSANNGNWQWAAGCGCDAAPYFRVFNPTLQREKFDKEGIYIRRWVPEWETAAYPDPIVDHKEASKRAVAVYSLAVK